MKELIYLDYNSTTPIDPRVLDTMMPFLKDQYANAASNHAFGVAINQEIKNARASVAQLIGSEDNEIVFTSGATEAINMAIKGVAENYCDRGKHIITATTEHPAVLDTCEHLQKKGFELSYLEVDSNGLISIDDLKNQLRSDTILVCTMMVNNETGVMQPIREIAQFTHENGSFFMTDATQAVGKAPIDVREIDIDLMAFSAHKFYGPKGVGALFVRNKRPYKVKPEALLHGGGHERALRSGTLNVPGIVGLGAASALSLSEMQSDMKRISQLRDYLEELLLAIPGSKINGSQSNRLYNITNIRFANTDADAIMAGLDQIALSNGSACSSTKVEPSHVLVAMGLSTQEAYSSLRISLGRFTSKEDINKASKQIQNVVESLRAMHV
ncbi:IscS subfamily cysteine desulfurase [Roseivirga sp. 4D4]|uniref:cysteine desulfurase family protein n=1 Tax=Roseivirga sp. 4D4 TaxID=1889784 RepID=UPI0008531424|nr:cysteine desulfurase family protein [Roseivirga sp. 4D4]OEK03096.1 IscS subfamily cysteine desulfurase [Roseivirga sp. 4D4]